MSVVAVGAEPKRVETEAALPDWNAGAGVAITAGAGLAGLVGAPLYSAVVERRVGTRTWLAFNVGLAYDSREQRLAPAFGADALERETIGVYSSNTSLLLGLRHAFAQKLVEVSLVGSLGVSRQSIWRDGLREGETIASLEAIPSKQYRVGVLGGLTLERELIEALALRLSLDAASLSFTSSESESNDTLAGSSSRQSWRAAVLLQAGLQLHFYF